MEKSAVLVSLGKRVRALRLDHGWSQEEFAARCGLDRTYVGGAERGERNVGVLNLVRMANTLGVKVGSLFDPGTDHSGQKPRHKRSRTFKT